jgi:hypothetical protein
MIWQQTPGGSLSKLTSLEANDQVLMPCWGKTLFVSYHVQTRLVVNTASYAVIQNATSPRVKSPSSVEVKNEWSYTCIPPYVALRGG